MRGVLDLTTFGIAPEINNMTNITTSTRNLTNISSNGYYGYQPPVEDFPALRLDMKVLHDKTVMEQYWQIQEQIQNDEEMEMPPIRNRNTRKRQFNDIDTQFEDFKRRRQNDYPLMCSITPCIRSAPITDHPVYFREGEITPFRMNVVSNCYQVTECNPKILMQKKRCAT